MTALSKRMDKKGKKQEDEPHENCVDRQPKLMFNPYTPPCFAAIGAMNAEMRSAKWVWGGIGLQLAVGYSVAYLVYTIGTLIAGGTHPIGATIGGGIAIAAMIAVAVGLIVNANKKMKTEYALKGTK